MLICSPISCPKSFNLICLSCLVYGGGNAIAVPGHQQNPGCRTLKKRTPCMPFAASSVVFLMTIGPVNDQVEEYSRHHTALSDSSRHIKRGVAVFISYLLTYCPSCRRQLGQQQILSISGGLEPVSVRSPMNVPWLSPLPQQNVSTSSLDAHVFCVPLVSIRCFYFDYILLNCL